MSSQLKNFTLFPKLPPELRQMIWFYAKDQYPRIHKIREAVIMGGNTITWSLNISGTPNALLATNEESRAIALKTTARIFDNYDFENTGAFMPRHAAVVFDLEVDTLCINTMRYAHGLQLAPLLSHIFTPFSLRTLKQGLRYLAASPCFWCPILAGRDLKTIGEFESLVELMYATEEGRTNPCLQGTNIRGLRDYGPREQVMRGRLKTAVDDVGIEKERNEGRAWKKPNVRLVFITRGRNR